MQLLPTTAKEVTGKHGGGGCDRLEGVWRQSFHFGRILVESFLFFTQALFPVRRLFFVLPPCWQQLWPEALRFQVL